MERQTGVDAFSDIVSPSDISTAADDLAYYGQDASKEFTGAPALILFPRSTEDVQRIVKRANERRIALVPSGGRTGYSGGATATKGEVVVSLERMRRIFSLDRAARVIHCEAGLTTEKVADAAREAGLYYPVDFASRGSSHIGGNIATNAGGIRVVRYGSTREWILGLTVVTGAGERLELNGPLMKNQTGYDLRGLLIGSEGTLGVVTEAWVRLTTPPPATARALCAIHGAEEAVSLMQRIRDSAFQLHVIEYFERNGLEIVLRAEPSLRDPFSNVHPAYLLLEVEAEGEDSDVFAAFLAEELEAARMCDVVIAQNERQRVELFQLRERISESIRKVALPHKNDISVALSQTPPFLQQLREVAKAEFPEAELVVFGHIGDGNLHLNYLKPTAMSKEQFLERCRSLDEKVFQLLSTFRGSISAEHGVGLLKRDYLHYSRSPAEIELMRAVKGVFDPHNILNPGKLV